MKKLGSKIISSFSRKPSKNEDGKEEEATEHQKLRGKDLFRGTSKTAIAANRFQYNAEKAKQEREAEELATRVAENLVREIQNILKIAKETGPSRGAHPPNQRNQRRSPSGLPTPWAQQLCELIDGTKSTYQSSEQAGKLAQEIDSLDTDQQGIEEIVGELLQPDVQGDMCGILLALMEILPEQKLAKRCLDAGLAPHLVHCLRLMRVAELNACKVPEEPATGDAALRPSSARRSFHQRVASDHSHSRSRSRADSFLEEPGNFPELCTVLAAQRTSALLEMLCRGGGSIVGSLLRQHLTGLISLAVSPYPVRSLHLQQEASKVVKALSQHSLTDQVVWFLHDKKAVLNIMNDLRGLVAFQQSGPEEQRAVQGELLFGKQAEGEGLWLTALSALVTFIKCSSQIEESVLQDFEQSGLYEVIRHMIEQAQSRNRLICSLEHLSTLVTSGHPALRTNSSHGSGSLQHTPKSKEIDDLMLEHEAKNMDAFAIVQKMLFKHTPFLKDVCEAEGSETLQLYDIILTVARKAAGKVVTLSPMQLGPPPLEEKEVQTSVTTDEFRLHLLHSVLQIYSQHPRNYEILERRFHVLSYYIACMISFESQELKLMVMKTMELICTGGADEVPQEVVRTTCLVFQVCCEEMLTAAMAEAGISKAQEEQTQDTVEAKSRILNKSTPSSLLVDAHLICATLEKLLKFDSNYSKLLVACGLLDEVMQPLLLKILSVCEGFIKSHKDDLWREDGSFSQEQCLDVSLSLTTEADKTLPKLEGYALADHACTFLCQLLELVLADKVGAVQYRSLLLDKQLYDVIVKLGPAATDAALRVLQKVSFTTKEDLLHDLEFLIDLNQETRDERWRQAAVLLGLRDFMGIHDMARDLFREANGFRILIGVLSTLDHVFDSKTPCDLVPEESRQKLNESKVSQHSAEANFQVVRASIMLLAGSLGSGPEGGDPLKGHIKNRQYFRDEVSYDTLTLCMKNSGVLSADSYSERSMDLIFVLLTGSYNAERNLEDCSICNPDAINVFLNVLPKMSTVVAFKALTKLNALVTRASAAELEYLVNTGALRRLSVEFVQQHSGDNQLLDVVLVLLFKLAEHRMQITDFSYILRCLALPILQTHPSNHSSPAIAAHKRIGFSEITPDMESINRQWQRLATLKQVSDQGSSVPHFQMGGGDYASVQTAFRSVFPNPTKISMSDDVISYPRQLATYGMHYIQVELVKMNNLMQYPPWPPSSGYTFSCWFMLDISDEDSTPEGLASEDESQIIWLVSFCSLDQQAYHFAYLDIAKCQVHFFSHQTGDICFFVGPNFFSKGMWHHIVLSHRKEKRFLGNKDILTIFLDGEQVGNQTCDAIQWTSCPLDCLLGAPPLLAVLMLPDRWSKPQRGKMTVVVTPRWRLGPSLLINEVIPPAQIQGMYFTGPEYTGSFVGSRPLFSNSSALMTNVLRRLHKSNTNIKAALERRGLQVLQDQWLSQEGNIWRFHFEFGQGIDDLESIVPSLLPDQVLFAYNARRLANPNEDHVESIPEISSYLANTAAQEGQMPIAYLYGENSCISPISVPYIIQGAGGVHILFPLLHWASSCQALCVTLSLIDSVVRGCCASTFYMQQQGGYHLVAHLLRIKREFLDQTVLDCCLTMAIDGFSWLFEVDSTHNPPTQVIVTDPWALKSLVLNYHVWDFTQRSGLLLHLLNILRRLAEISELNIKCFQSMDVVEWTLHNVMEVCTTKGKDQPDEILLTSTSLLQHILKKTLDSSVLKEISQLVLSTLTYTEDSELEAFPNAVSEKVLAPHALARLSLLRMILDLLLVKAGFEQKEEQSHKKHLRSRGSSYSLTTSLTSSEPKTQNIFIENLTPNWFMCIIEGVQEEATVTVVLRILGALLQETSEFRDIFYEQGGFGLLSMAIPRYSSSSAIILLVLAILFEVSVHKLPISAELEFSELWRLFENAKYPVLEHVEYSQPLFEILMECIRRNCQLHQAGAPGADVARRANLLALMLVARAQALHTQSFQLCIRTPAYLSYVLGALFDCTLEIRRMQEESNAKAARSKENPFLSDIDEWCQIKQFMGSPHSENVQTICEGVKEQETVMLAGILATVMSDILSSPNTVTNLRALFGLFLPGTDPLEVLQFQDSLIKHMKNCILGDYLMTIDKEKSSKLAPICCFLLDIVYLRMCSAFGSVMALEIGLEIVQTVSKFNFHTTIGHSSQHKILGMTIPVCQIMVVQVLLHCNEAVYQEGLDDLINILPFSMHILLQPFNQHFEKGSQHLYNSSIIQHGVQLSNAISYFNKEQRNDTTHGLDQVTQNPIPLVYGPHFDEPTIYFITGVLAGLGDVMLSDDITIRIKMLLILKSLLGRNSALMMELLAPKRIEEDGMGPSDLYVGGLEKLEPGGTVFEELQKAIPDFIEQNDFNTIDFHAAVESSEHLKGLLTWLDGHRQKFMCVIRAAKKQVKKNLPNNLEASGMHLVKEIQKDREARNREVIVKNMANTGISQFDLINEASEEWRLSHYIWQKKTLEDFVWCIRRWKAMLVELSTDISVWALAGTLEQGKTKRVLWKLDLTEGSERVRRRFQPNHSFFNMYNVTELVPCKGGLQDGQKGGEKDPGGAAVTNAMSNVPLSPRSKLKFKDAVDLLITLKKLQSQSSGEARTQLPDDFFDEGLEDLDIDERTPETSLDVNFSEGAVPIRSDENPDLQLPPDSLPGENSMQSNQLPPNPLDSIPETEMPELKPIEEETIAKPILTRTITDYIECPDRDLLMGLIAENDRPLIACYNVKRCMGLEVNPGLFVLCKHAIYIVAGFEKQGTGPGLDGVQRRSKGESTQEQEVISKRPLPEVFQVQLRRSTSSFDGPEGPCISRKATVLDANNALSNLFDKDAMNSNDEEIMTTSELHCAHIHFDNLLVVFKRRYELRRNSLEFFDCEGRSYMTVFDSEKIQEKVLSFVLNAHLPNCVFFNSGYTRTARIKYKHIVKRLRLKMTHQWQQGKITNFEYLMALNSFAGRTFNDLTQYPVFPWVLKDYDSETLDFKDENIYRDLSRPMGALGEERAHDFQERFNGQAEMPDDGSCPPFHYGTHYSCSGYVLHYLVRMEPFSGLALTLQGGKFDKADRLFRDVKASWESASKENLQDVRELIPEFYYLPEFLINSNHFDFGVTQRGNAVNNIILPPWAKNDPRRFVSLHRQALESEYVSRNLHQWIDLIFGFKQQGKDAELAQNVFVHITYEDEVDIDAIEDPLLREATIAQINNFGQTPSKLFKKPHPAKKPPPLFKAGPDNTQVVDTTALAWYEPLSPPLCLVGYPGEVFLEEVSRFESGIQSIGDVWHHKDKLLGLKNSCVFRPPSSATYIRFGSAANGFAFYSASHWSTTSALYQKDEKLLRAHDDLHLSPVSCLAVTDCGSIIVTGSYDSTVKVWSIASGKSMDIHLRATLCGHEDSISCVDICTKTGNVVSGGHDKRVIIWDLRRNRYLRKLSNHRGPVTSVSINKCTGDIVTLGGGELRIYSINGDLLAVSESIRKDDPTKAISTNCPFWQNGIVALVGHKCGGISLWEINHDQPYFKVLDSDSISSEEGAETKNKSSVLHQGNEVSNTIPARFSAPKQLEEKTRFGQQVHKVEITALKILSGQEVLVADKNGLISRWGCVRIDRLPAHVQDALLSER